MKMKENWKLLIGFENYEISDFGNVRKLNDINLIAQQKNAKGYLMFYVKKNGNFYRKLTHREMLKSFVGCYDERLHACHNDGNKLNNKLSNIRWDTAANNNKDKILHGTSKKGVLNPAAKLNDNQVVEIFLSKESSPKLAAIHKVAQSTIAKIKTRKKWQHVTNSL